MNLVDNRGDIERLSPKESASGRRIVATKHFNVQQSADLSNSSKSLSRRVAHRRRFHMTELGPIGPNPMPCCYGVYGKHNSYCPTLAARPSALVELLDELRTEIDIAKAQRTVRRDRSEGAVHISVEQAESLIAELSALKEDALTGYEAETVLHELLGKPNKGPEFDDRYEARERALVKLRRISSSK